MPRPTQEPHHGVRFISPTGLSPSSRRLSRRFGYKTVFFTPRVIPMRPYNPALLRFGLLRVRSPLLAESQLMSFPGLLRWFTSPSVALPSYFIQTLQCMNHFIRVTPFGYPRITGYVLLPAAFRSLSRPSSPVSSKASAMDLYSLDHITFLPPGFCFTALTDIKLFRLHSQNSRKSSLQTSRCSLP